MITFVDNSDVIGARPVMTRLAGTAPGSFSRRSCMAQEVIYRKQYHS